MERKKYSGKLILVFFVMMVGFQLSSQPGFKMNLYQSYISGDMVRWQQEVIQIEQMRNLSDWQKVELLEGYYGLIGWLLGNDKTQEAKSYIGKGEKLMDEMLKANPANSTVLAFQGAFYGFSIGLQKYKAVVLGPKSMNAVKKALELDPANIQAHIEKGNILYYSPGLVGGDKSKSVGFYEKACQLMEKSGKSKNNWLYLSTSVQLAKITEELGDKEKARLIYEKLLTEEPGFLWVKNELLPGLINPQNASK